MEFLLNFVSRINSTIKMITYPHAAINRLAVALFIPKITCFIVLIITGDNVTPNPIKVRASEIAIVIDVFGTDSDT